MINTLQSNTVMVAIYLHRIAIHGFVTINYAMRGMELTRGLQRNGDDW